MEGAKVYVSDGDWQKATIVATLGGGKYRVQLEAWEGGAVGDIIEVDASKLGGTLPFQNANMPPEGFPNMTNLDHLHEAALLHNLRARFFGGVGPYTYTAEIVIAVNPYQWFPDLYTDEVRKEYLVFDRAKLPPHVYATSSAAYSGLQETREDQAILVSGESGAGKTETVKILMGHLALIASSEDSLHIKRIVDSNPLLESFGNAQTVRNDNSSRFGKFIELELNSSCRLVGSSCRTYLLEKSRVVGQDAGERNYHIFYQMMASDCGRFGIRLGTRETMRYTRLGQSKIDRIEGKLDSERFEDTIRALEMVGVEGDTLTQLMRALALVLLLGELEFETLDGAEDTAAFGGAPSVAAEAAQMLGVDVHLLEKTLTTRTIRTRNEEMIKSLSTENSAASRDALAKELYSRVFDWLVQCVCAATAAGGGQVNHFIGLLDIFGFESFAINRFEQLCINYANEKLQQKFTLDVFKSVQQEYSEEGIPWDRIEFKDNAPVLALIEAKLGIIAMLNEEGVRPKGSDGIFVSKLMSVHKADPAFSTPKVGKLREVQFSVRHYAGEVTYTTTGWLERNKDTISDDVTALMSQSTNPLIVSIFSALGKAGKATVATQFKNSLAQLMETIGKTHTQYVRCIKPNKTKSPTLVENSMVLDQLRCAGVIEAVRISRAGFPARMPLKEFSQRFAVVARVEAGITDPAVVSIERAKAAASAVAVLASDAGDRDKSRYLISALAPESRELYEIGRTRMYFKRGVLESMEDRRALVIQAAATQLGRFVRGYQARQRFRRQLHAVVLVQARRRMHAARTVYLVMRRVVIFCQALRRGSVARQCTRELLRNLRSTRLQAAWRSYQAQKQFSRVRSAAVVVQSVIRGRVCRRQYLVMQSEAKEHMNLENRLKDLEEKLAAKSSEMYTPPAEIMQALEDLGKENKKLHMELDQMRTENRNLRRQVQELRATQESRGALVSFFSRSAAATAEKTEKADRDRKGRRHSRGPKPPLRRLSGIRDDGSTGASPPCTPRDLQLTPREAERNGDKHEPDLGVFNEVTPQPLCVYRPLSEFWEDIPNEAIPLLKSGTEVHIKLGPNLLMVDHKGRNLVWSNGMTNASGYRRSMGFYLERRAERRSDRPRSSIIGGLLNSDSTCDHMPGPGDEGCLGLAFAIRSSHTNKYVLVGGMLDGYCLLVTGEKPEDAAVFTIMPLQGAEANSAVGDSVAKYAFVMRLLGESKCLSLRKDGYVTTTVVSDDDTNIETRTMAASIECLMPSTSYEITVYEQQIGLTVGVDLPLKVSRIVTPPTGEPGPAERSGRVRVGDEIKYVNGQDITGFPRKDVLSMISCRRPVTLGFTTTMQL